MFSLIHLVEVQTLNLALIVITSTVKVLQMCYLRKQNIGQDPDYNLI